MESIHGVTEHVKNLGNKIEQYCHIRLGGNFGARILLA